MKAIEAAKKLLLANASKAKLFGMSDSIEVIMRALDEVDSIVSAQVEANLLMALEMQNTLGLKLKIHAAHLQLLGNTSDFARTLSHRLQHGSCTCNDCMQEVAQLQTHVARANELQSQTIGGTTVRHKG